MTVRRRFPRLLGLPVLAMLAASAAGGNGPLTESEAVRLGLQHPAANARRNARLEVAEGQVEAAGRWANPEIEYSRETLSLPSGEAEERSLWLRQRINLAGVHGLTREAANHQHRAADLRNQYTRQERAADIRGRFYQALAAQRDASLVAEWHRRFTELTSAVEQRVAAGDASRYELARLRQELASLEGQRLRAQAEAASARDRLAQLIGDEPGPVTGRLLPPELGAANPAEPIARHPLMRALSAEAEGAQARARAAQRQRWPELTLGVGRKEVIEPGLQAEGNQISLGIEIPLFDRHSGEARTQRGLAHQRKADVALARAELATRIRTLRRSLAAQRQAAQALRQSENTTASSLSSIAESSYAAGELSVRELIDAHRSELSAQREALQQELDARTRYIQLKLLTGENS